MTAYQDRPYQAADEAKILGALQMGRNPLYCLPPRGGKTLTTARVHNRVLGATDWTCGFIVHRRELLKQASETLHQNGIAHGLIWPESRVGVERVHIASIDTLNARVHAGDRETIDWLEHLRLVTADECHRVISPKWMSAINLAAKALKLGLSGTPWRLDGRSLGAVFDTAIKGPGVRQLTRQGYLAPFHAYAPNVTVRLRGLKKVGGDYQLSDLQNLMDDTVYTQAAVRGYARWAAGMPCIVFCTGRDHAENVASAFRRAGWRSMAVDYTTPTKIRDQALCDLASGDLHVLTSVELVSEGTDIPAVGCAIGLRPTASTRLYLQSYLRCLTPHRDKDAAVMIDVAGNIMAHGMPDAPRDWTLEGGIRGMERQVADTQRCPRCCRVHEYSNACPGCGYAYGMRQISRSDPVPRLIAGWSEIEIKTMPYSMLCRAVRQMNPFDGRAVEILRKMSDGWARDLKNGRI